MDHEKLDVYQVSLDFASWAYELCKKLNGLDRFARDQLIRASQSIVLNIAEGCGRASSADKTHFMRIASGSARECGAVLDILCKSSVINSDSWNKGKTLLKRIVSMLKKMQDYFYSIKEDNLEYQIESKNNILIDS